MSRVAHIYLSCIYKKGSVFARIFLSKKQKYISLKKTSKISTMDCLRDALRDV